MRTGSDCETLLHLYEQHGDDFLQRVNGMFAFALWDSRRRRLVLGRDRLGIKPLYVWNDGRRLIFASEAKAMLAVPGVPTELDPQALPSLPGAWLRPGPAVDVPRHSPSCRRQRCSSRRTAASGERRYWRPPDRVERAVDEANWIERVRDRLDESVRMQMVSDVPIGAFLSGGVDSSAVVAFMATHSERPVKTYSIGFDGGAAEAFYNELPYARQVAEQFGTEHHEILVRPDVVALLPMLLWHMDEPIADTAFITTYLVSEFARRDVTVILSGVGGDELFGGYRRYLGNHYQRRFDRLPAVHAAGHGGGRSPFAERPPFAAAEHDAAGEGFLSAAGLPFEERYRSYVAGVRRRDDGASCCARRTTRAPIRSPQRSPMRRATTI